MPYQMSSRERMLRALDGQDVDHTPCAFMSFSAMRGRCYDAYEVVEKELAWGLDSMVFVPSAWRNERRNHPDLRGLPVRLPPETDVRLWEENVPGDPCPILHKEYHTPAGKLWTRVRKTADWPHGNFVPYIDDYQIPRATKPLITNPDDLEVLRALLREPGPDTIGAFQVECAKAQAFARAHDIMLTGGWGVGGDMVAWLCGLEPLMLMAYDQPRVLRELLEIISVWNQARMRVLLEAGIDLYIRRGWYEGAEFWSPQLYERFLLPLLRKEAELAHEHGTAFGYIMTTGALPMLDHIREAGVDVLLGADPLQSDNEPLGIMREKLGGRVAIWGGVNGAITVEQGTAQDVRRAVSYALETMRNVPGFVLSPVDNITEITRKTWRNVEVLIDTWKELR